jgi:hypothetical protein
MKRLHLFFLLGIVVVGCKNTEINDPAMQAELDSTLFIALDTRAIENEDESYVIQGITQNETLTLKLSDLVVGRYQLGGASVNYASFENVNGDTYFTNPQGEGEVVISNWDRDANLVSGSFKFTAIIAGIDTIAVQRGLFFEAPVKSYVEPSIETVDPSTNAGTFVSFIDGNPFNPFNVSAVETVDSIIITASTSNRSIIIKMPRDIQMGNIVLPEMGHLAQYKDGNGTEDALSGNLIIFSHMVNARKIKGTFSFQTDTKSISLGQFNVIYE